MIGNACPQKRQTAGAGATVPSAERPQQNSAITTQFFQREEMEMMKFSTKAAGAAVFVLSLLGGTSAFAQTAVADATVAFLMAEECRAELQILCRE